ncbi:FAD-dependent oxidoreductase [Pleomorphomonas carboxyditropha]|uniref:Pyridine nucleotide-disulfide oxidoreductase n=1 Tax=Pleomorphomonas carboxyditropha TaxID=2023338 RepID=A0A2G9WWJ9_9HYPH|nr:FAD-dependent oxidoreductase [Pleomorphomonas carboxyditropha]PIO99095.1 pyridine nucleotide-disulfide oxidoreductase [Pleomorphomonas carboxyditropha]
MKIIIIGGVAGGATAAARLRRLDERAEIILVERGPYISFANCGLPYHISGAIADRDKLLVTSEAGFEARYHVDVRPRTEALSIDRAARTVTLRNLDSGEETAESYDRLLLSPGAEVLKPPIPGIASPRIFTLRNIPDLDRIMASLSETRPRRAVVIGGGYIGLEVAENFHERGLFTTVVEGASHVLAPFDDEMAAIVHAHMRDKAIELFLDDKVEHFEDRADHTIVFLASGKRIQADIVVLAIGVRPELKLARDAGLELGAVGGIRVDEHLATSDPDIFAVGDAVEVMNRVSGRMALIPLAGPANRQARIVADNMLSADPTGYRSYGGTLGTAILKVFDLAAACTGLSETAAKALGIPYRANITHSGSHASYYPGSQQISLKLVYGLDGTILGAQAVGIDGADKRIDVIATAIRAGLKVTDLTELELAYAPPFGSAKDPVNVAGYVAENVLNGSHRIVDWRELHDLLRVAPASVQLVDVRTPEEFSIRTLPGARNIELDHLRERIGELDPEKPLIVFCQVGLRGYLAYRVLKQAGFKDVRNLTGGFKTYAWATEKQSSQDIFDYEDIRRRDPSEIEAQKGDCRVAVTAGVQVLDVTGLQCPGPILKTFRAIEAMETGELLEVKASDPAFGRDIRAWADRTGHRLLGVETGKGVITARVRKAAPAAITAEAGPAAASRDGTTLVVFSGDLDKVMASLIIANGALAMGSKVTLFFTFWGLNVLRKPDAPSPRKPMIDAAFGFLLPKGAGRLNRLSNMNFGGIGGRLMRKVMGDRHVDTPASLLAALVDGGAALIACQMSMDVMGIRREELIDGVEIGGVATFLGEAQRSATALFI